MLALSASTRFVAAPAKAQVARRQQVVVCAQAADQQPVERRAVLGLVAAAVLGLTATAAEAAQPAPKNSYRASSEGYNLEGTKKQGISAKRKKQLLAKLKASAGK